MNESQSPNNERRSFLKWSSLLGGSAIAAVVGGYTAAFINRDKELIIVDLESSPVVTTDANQGWHCRLLVTQDFMLANPTNAIDGQRMVWEFIQDTAGGHNMRVDDKFAFGSDLKEIVLSTAPDKRDFMTAIYNLSTDKWYVVAFIKGY